MRITIVPNLTTIGQHTLVGQIEWEVSNPLNSPEPCAGQMAREFSSAGEFRTAIAHSIRERRMSDSTIQIDQYKIENKTSLQSTIIAIVNPDFPPLCHKAHLFPSTVAERSES